MSSVSPQNISICSFIRDTEVLQTAAYTRWGNDTALQRAVFDEAGISLNAEHMSSSFQSTPQDMLEFLYLLAKLKGEPRKESEIVPIVDSMHGATNNTVPQEQSTSRLCSCIVFII